MITVECPVSSLPPRVTQETIGTVVVRFHVAGEDEQDIPSRQEGRFDVTQEDNPMPVSVHENPLDGLAWRYAQAAAHLASDRLERLESGEWVARVPSMPGLWASGDTPNECLEEFRQTTVSWVKVKVAQGHRDIPVLADIDLNIF
jgi:predicted RNase H-like HicB family nuclease